MAFEQPVYAFLLVRCGSRLPDDSDYTTRKLLHIHLEKSDCRFPNGLVCPDLRNLWLQCNKHIQQFSSGFFAMFVNLRFLLIEDMLSSSERKLSLQPLGNLRTLILDGCDMRYIDQTNDSFFPEELETLCIWNCDLQVPLYLPNLKHLRKLEIQGWRGISVQMVPNTISSMPSLEELHIPGGFSIDGPGISLDDGSGIIVDAISAPALVEISKLTGLKSLQMLFIQVSQHFQDTDIFNNLLEFNVCVGQGRDIRYFLESSVSFKRSIELYGTKLEALNSLVETAENVKLECTHINMSGIYNSNGKAFTDLRNLYIKECNTMGHLASTTRDGIQQCLQKRTSFSNLTILTIIDCSAIKYLFSMSVAKFLEKLQQLHIRGCLLMEAIIVNEEGTSDGDNDIINFSKLKSLRLENMPKLKSFYRENKDMHSSTQASIVEHSDISPVLYQPLFDGMVAFPSLEELTIEHLEDTVSDIWGKCYYNDDNSVSSSFCKLKRLSVYNCIKLETVILLPMSRTLRNLEYLDIYVCSRLKNVFQHSFVARELIHLKTLEVDSCDIMRGIIGSGDERKQEITVDDDGIIVFPQLTVLKLFALPELSSFWCYQSTGEPSSYKVQFPHLVDFELGYVEINMEDIGLAGELKRLCISCDNEIQLPYEWPLQLYNLEELKLKRCWHHQLKSLCFQRLKVLHVHNSGCSTLFTSSAFRSLQQLQKLEISNCASLEEIVEDVRDDEATGMDNKTITLVQLKTLILRDLPNLKSFIHGSKYECHMLALLKVEVHNCGLSTLFTCSVFRKLEQLKELKVSNCTLLEGIVEDVRNDEINFTKGNIISVSQLSSVVLEDLPNLKRFSSTSSYSFNMPNFHEFVMRKCPLIEYFTFLKTSTRELVSVYSEWHQGEKIQDLNDYIRQIRKRGSDSDGESSYIDQKLETKSERTDKEKPLEAEENDQP